jgi:carboxypeptidase Taq
MHIIVRYEIERGLLDGSIKVPDVPKAWGDKMEKYLGARPPSDAQGCLQVRLWSTLWVKGWDDEAVCLLASW